MFPLTSEKYHLEFIQLTKDFQLLKLFTTSLKSFVCIVDFFIHKRKFLACKCYYNFSFCMKLGLVELPPYASMASRGLHFCLYMICMKWRLFYHWKASRSNVSYIDILRGGGYNMIVFSNAYCDYDDIFMNFVNDFDVFSQITSWC